jgi:hypothetical protein
MQPSGKQFMPGPAQENVVWLPAASQAISSFVELEQTRVFGVQLTHPSPG